MDKKQNLCTLWDVWSNELPAKFKKNEVVEALTVRWGITRENVYRQIRKGNLKNFVHDVSFLHTHFGIGYKMDTGFFFDDAQYTIIQQRTELEGARLFGLSKSL